MNNLLGATEFAELLGVSRQRVQQIAKAGAIPHMKLGNTLIFHRRDVIRYLGDRYNQEEDLSARSASSRPPSKSRRTSA